MSGGAGSTWQMYLWASVGCYALFYVVTNVVIERRIGSPTPPGSALPVFLFGYALVVLVVGYWYALGYRAEFTAHTRGQLVSALAAGAAAGGGLVCFFLAANRAGADAGGQATIIAVLNLAPVPALLVLFALDAWAEGANMRHVMMRAVGALLALLGGVLLAVYSAG